MVWVSLSVSTSREAGEGALLTDSSYLNIEFLGLYKHASEQLQRNASSTVFLLGQVPFKDNVVWNRNVFMANFCIMNLESYQTTLLLWAILDLYLWREETIKNCMHNLAFVFVFFHLLLSLHFIELVFYGLHKSFLRSEDLMKLYLYPGIELQPG